MPATTNNLAIPYPVPTDKVTDYPTTANTAATITDRQLSRVRNGSVSVSATNAVTTNTIVVNFPAGVFTATPSVVLQTIGTSGWIAYHPVSPTVNGFSVAAATKSGTAASITGLIIHWIAVQGA